MTRKQDGDSARVAPINKELTKSFLKLKCRSYLALRHSSIHLDATKVLYVTIDFEDPVLILILILIYCSVNAIYTLSQCE